MKIVDIANEIYIDAGSPTDTSIPAIAFWIRGKMGALNVMLYEDLIIDETTQELIDTSSDNGDGQLSYAMIAIIKQLYRVYDYEVQIRNTMNALAKDAILSIEDQGTTITKINRNSVSQTLRQVRKDEMDLLQKMVSFYVIGQHSAIPRQVAGDDTMGGTFNDQVSLYPSYIRRY